MNKRIDEIDKNFKIETSLKLNNPKAYDPRCAPFKIYGVEYSDGRYRRLPRAIADSVSTNVGILSESTSGGVIKFKTDSSYVAIKTKSGKNLMSHQALVGSSGFDLYIGNPEQFLGSFRPANDFEGGYESVLYVPNRCMREITINMPPYTGVSEVIIILEKDAKVKESRGYKYKKPIVYYGSSITQGACANRPGNAYPCFISRALSIPQINLGFSGSAKGEREIAEYIAGLDMSIFVYDYDYNAPSLDHIKETHERMFKFIREKQPELPIVILTRPRYWLVDYEKDRLEVIKATYENARARGDENVYLVTGRELMRYAKYDGHVDDAHPTDLGFYSMAKVLTPLLRSILKKQAK